jgi:hypothetical protein
MSLRGISIVWEGDSLNFGAFFNCIILMWVSRVGVGYNLIVINSKLHIFDKKGAKLATHH